MSRDLTHAILGFGATLRLNGLPVTTGALMDSLRALAVVGVSHRDKVYLALRTILAGRLEEWPIFDRCFDAFWKYRENLATAFQQVAVRGEAETDNHDEPVSLDSTQLMRSDMEAIAIENNEEVETESLDTPGESAIEILADKDFATFSEEQLDEVARAAVAIAKRLARQLNRRRKLSRRGPIDFRRSIRVNLTRGEIIEFRRRARKRKKVRLVVLCDVSGSMDLYSRFLLQFLYSLQNVFGRIETFAFATRLTRVTDLLRGPSYKHALSRLAGVRDWSGGTRIGDAFREFNANWSRLVDHRTIVVLLSDGWDTGNPEILERELLAIKRRAGRVVWLNPLLGNPTYEPLTRGMAAALPLIHFFAPAHNLDSLRALGRYLTLR
jgi:uncharacterized protein